MVADVPSATPGAHKVGPGPQPASAVQQSPRTGAAVVLVRLHRGRGPTLQIHGCRRQAAVDATRGMLVHRGEIGAEARRVVDVLEDAHGDRPTSLPEVPSVVRPVGDDTRAACGSVHCFTAARGLSHATQDEAPEDL